MHTYMYSAEYFVNVVSINKLTIFLESGCSCSLASCNGVSPSVDTCGSIPQYNNFSISQVRAASSLPCSKHTYNIYTM